MSQEIEIGLSILEGSKVAVSSSPWCSSTVLSHPGQVRASASQPTRKRLNATLIPSLELHAPIHASDWPEAI